MWVVDEVVVGIGCGFEGKGKGELQKRAFWRDIWYTFIISKAL